MSKEIRHIIQAYHKAKNENKQCCLATVVHVEGSSYRRPGARMLVTENGEMTGAISGGCLEGDALRKALLALSEGKNKLVTYDTTDEDDARVGVQLGCNGIIHILFEPIYPTIEHHPIRLLEMAVAERKKAVIVTIFALKEKEQPGTKLLLTDEAIIKKDSDFPLPDALIADVRLASQREASSIGVYAINEKNYTAFIEFIPPQVSLVIIGAGNDAIPLVDIAHILGWRTVLVDGRPTNVTPHRFPNASQLIVARPHELLNHVSVDAQTVFVLLTHNYNYDLSVLSILINENTPYIGILGPKKKQQRLLDELKEKGMAVDEQQRSKIYGPTGLDIGAEMPEEIALSIIAEIKAVLSNKQSNFLRDREGPIHSSSAPLEPLHNQL